MNHFFKNLILFCISLILIASIILVYSHYIGTSGLNVKEQAIHYENLSKDIYGLKFVHISDIHYGRTIHEKELENLVKQINLTKPDILVFTGDLIDKDTQLSSEEENKIIEILKKIDVNIGKYAVMGDHDQENFDHLIVSSGFTNLNDQYETIYFNATDYILIAGINTNNNKNDKIKEVLSYIETSEVKPNYSILLLHKPDVIDQIDYSKFNLILAGHSHNGQIRIPGIGAILKWKGSQKYYDSHYTLNNSELYISGGLGVAEINFRLFNHPSFNLYRLVN